MQVALRWKHELPPGKVTLTLEETESLAKSPCAAPLEMPEAR